MKIGDKVICIKDCYIGSKLLHKKGSFYKINFAGAESRIYVTNDTLLYDTLFLLEDDPLFEYLIFSDYFARLKENRKQKLEKINGIQN